MEVSHLFGLAAYVLTIYLFLKNVPKARTMLIYSILAGLVMSTYLALEQYFVGFKEMREFIENQGKTGIRQNGDLNARIFDERVSAPFTGSNSLAGF
jgi:hypothetical protein